LTTLDLKNDHSNRNTLPAAQTHIVATCRVCSGQATLQRCQLIEVTRRVNLRAIAFVSSRDLS
jgi:hypothetical protein